MRTNGAEQLLRPRQSHFRGTRRVGHVRAAALVTLTLTHAMACGAGEAEGPILDLGAEADVGRDVSAEADSGTSEPGVRPTSSGRVRGVEREGVWSFRGVPFAAAPVDSLRFRPPEPPVAWEGVVDADAYGPACVQIGADGVVGEEDCLTLNVWTAAERGADKPVMVWIHGGDNVVGSAAGHWLFGPDFFDGTSLVKSGDVVFVSIQYRLGAFGFLAHPDFAAENTRGATGNWGLMDQIAALEWVRDNIEAFGGDPGNVTVFGQSAGADDTCALVASPRADGLLHRAMMMSPGGCHTNDPAVSARTTSALLEALACGDADSQTECVRSASTPALANAPQAGSPANPNRIDFYVELDGWVLTEPPLTTFRRGGHATVPMVFGTTAEEYAMFLASSLPDSISEAEYLQFMNELFGSARGEEVVGAYPPSDYGGSRHLGLIAALGDAVHHCAVRRAASAAAQHGPVYRYVWAQPYADTDLARYGSAHGYDLPMVFGNDGDLDLSDDERILAGSMQAAILAFARSGVPGAPGAQPWPSYDGATDEIAVAATAWRTLPGFRDTQCDFSDAQE